MRAWIRELTMEDYEASYELWNSTPGIGLSEADSPESIRRFLERNPGLSFVAIGAEGQILGTVLAGHDGRRWFLYHLTVKPDTRGQGIGEKLVAAALDALRKQNIEKCHIMVLADNWAGQGFWTKRGWLKRDNILLYSMALETAGTDKGRTCGC